MYTSKALMPFSILYIEKKNMQRCLSFAQQAKYFFSFFIDLNFVYHGAYTSISFKIEIYQAKFLLGLYSKSFDIVLFFTKFVEQIFLRKLK